MLSSVSFSVVAIFLFVTLLQPSALQAAISSDNGAVDKPSVNDLPSKYLGEFEPSIGFYQSLELAKNSLLYSKQSKYQFIEVHQSKFYGKVLVLDGVIQLTERDADSYNEMMAHIPMFQHRNPKRVLVIGGGDGYVLKEVLKHQSVEHVDHVDLDEDVIRTCETYFPQWGDAWKDPRAHLHICDGAQFVRDTPDQFYDVIIQDSSDPWTVDDDGVMNPLPSGVLYEEDHICQLHRILKPNGILNIQGESFNLPTSLGEIISWRRNMEHCGFTRTRYGSISISSYPTGQIGLLLAEKDAYAASDYPSILTRYRNMVKAGKKTTYYHPPLQKGCFLLPLWVHDTIYGEEDSSDLLCKTNEIYLTKES